MDDMHAGHSRTRELLQQSRYEQQSRGRRILTRRAVLFLLGAFSITSCLIMFFFDAAVPGITADPGELCGNSCPDAITAETDRRDKILSRHAVSPDTREDISEQQSTVSAPDHPVRGTQVSAHDLVATESSGGLECSAWRQTAGCDPNGAREPTHDQDCTALIADGSSGYCECKHKTSGLINSAPVSAVSSSWLRGDIVKMGQRSCKHDTMTCKQICAQVVAPASQCQVGWRQTVNCDPFGDREEKSDLNCDAKVHKDASGYCECASDDISRVAGCGHSEFTCTEQCGVPHVKRTNMLMSIAMKVAGSRGSLLGCDAHGPHLQVPAIKWDTAAHHEMHPIESDQIAPDAESDSAAATIITDNGAVCIVFAASQGTPPEVLSKVRWVAGSQSAVFGEAVVCTRKLPDGAMFFNQSQCTKDGVSEGGISWCDLYIKVCAGAVDFRYKVRVHQISQTALSSSMWHSKLAAQPGASVLLSALF